MYSTIKVHVLGYYSFMFKMLPVTELMNIPDHTFVKSTQSSATTEQSSIHSSVLSLICSFLCWLVTSPSQFHSRVLGDKANHSLWTSNTLLCNTLISLMQYIRVWNFPQCGTTINYITYFLLYSCCYCYSKMKLKVWAAYYKTSTSDSTEAKK